MTDAKDQPGITVLMASYNAAEYVGPAIESVLGQTYERFELLVVDDGSTDSTVEIVRSYADPRVRLVSLQRNSGAAAARNHGMRAARADLIAILDADDIAYPRRLELEVAYMDDHPECSLLGCAFDLIDGSGRIRGTVPSPCETGMIRWCLLTKNVIGHSTVMLRRRDALAAGGYREDLRNGQDYALWTAMAPHTEVAQLPDVLVAYRDNPQGLTNTRTDRHRSDLMRIAQAALSRAAGREVSFEAIACLQGAPPAAPLRRDRCVEAARALTVALQKMVACDPSTRGLERDLLSDWRKQVERLGEIAPSVFSELVADSTRLSLETAGIRGLGAGYPTWLLRSLAFSVRGLQRRFRRSCEAAEH